MTDYLVTDTELTSVANAIRTKGGTSGSLSFPSGFVSAIEDIPSGGSTQMVNIAITNAFCIFKYPVSGYITEDPNNPALAVLTLPANSMFLALWTPDGWTVINSSNVTYETISLGRRATYRSVDIIYVGDTDGTVAFGDQQI